MFSKFKQQLNRKNLVLAILGLSLLVLGYVTVGYLTVRYQSRAAGVPSEIGYGCQTYGNAAVYGSCRIKLVSADIPNLNSSFTTTGIVCTPNPAEINTKISCTGTLNDKRLAPQNQLSLGVEGQAASQCTFVVDTFTCSNIVVGASAGTLKLFGNISPGTAIDTAVRLNIINHTLVAADLTPNNLLATSGPFSSIACGNNNTVTAGESTTCVLNIRPGFVIPADFKLGVGTNPGGQCVTAGSILTCSNVPSSTVAGLQDLKAQIGSSQVYLAGKTVNVVKTSIPTTPPNSTLTANTNPATGTNPASTVVTSLIRSGGLTIIAVIVGIFSALVLVWLAFGKFKSNK
jgi:hypothetical protein